MDDTWPRTPSRNENRERVLVVESDLEEGARLVAVLREAAYHATHTVCGEPAVQALASSDYDAVLLCSCAPGVRGLYVLSRARSLQTRAQFIVLADDETVGTAVEAIKLGAFDYLKKPANKDVLRHRLRRAMDERSLQREVASLRWRARADNQAGLVGSSRVMDSVFYLIERVAPTRSTVLITGETGTGKELVARAVHELSPRRTNPFVPIACSALPEHLLESELFGHVRGSFTGAANDRRGLFEEASGGTAFLDEVDTLSYTTQAKLLRVLEEHTVQRVGTNREIPVDLRLIAATNADLPSLVERGQFREDLYYRLNVFPISVPPLRDRPSDIPYLAVHFRDKFAAAFRLSAPAITAETMERLMRHEWRGNVRELRNVIERAVIISNGGTELTVDLTEGNAAESGHLMRMVDEGWSLKQFEAQYIRAVVDRTNGNRNKAARILGIDRRTLYRKLRETTN